MVISLSWFVQSSETIQYLMLNLYFSLRCTSHSVHHFELVLNSPFLNTNDKNYSMWDVRDFCMVAYSNRKIPHVLYSKVACTFLSAPAAVWW